MVLATKGGWLFEMESPRCCLCCFGIRKSGAALVGDHHFILHLHLWLGNPQVLPLGSDGGMGSNGRIWLGDIFRPRSNGDQRRFEFNRRPEDQE